MARQISLSDGEWKLMNLLWEKSPRTIAELVKALAGDTRWSKSTNFIMLVRMAEKGAVRVESGGRSKLYHAAASKSCLAAGETRSFLDKVYGGSLQLMVSSMAGLKALRRDDIEELYEILRRAEQEVES